MNKYFNPSTKEWQDSPFMEKEYTIKFDRFIATTIVVPFEKKDETGIGFAVSGVRIENVLARTTKKHNGVTYTLPGNSFFYKLKENLLSETFAPRFITNKANGLSVDGFIPLVESGEKKAGIKSENHRIGRELMVLIQMATKAYQVYRMTNFGR